MVGGVGCEGEVEVGGLGEGWGFEERVVDLDLFRFFFFFFVFFWVCLMVWEGVEKVVGEELDVGFSERGVIEWRASCLKDEGSKEGSEAF